VTGTQTYSLRNARTPATNEGMTALHVAAQSGRADLVRYLLGKGADPAIVDGNGRKPIDLVGRGGDAAAAGATRNRRLQASPGCVPCWSQQLPRSNGFSLDPNRACRGWRYFVSARVQRPPGGRRSRNLR
jgi:hypothetical protein